MSPIDSQDDSSPELQTWLSGLPAFSGPDTLLHFTKTPEGSIDLTHAHPSGLAQLLTGRRTRLSTLIRDPGQYAVALRAARALRAKIFELGSDRGIDAGYLSAGTATWTAVVRNKPRRITGPVMLSALTLTSRPGQDDFELQLTEQARFNPALERHLKAVHRIVFDVNAVVRLAYSTARFDPAPVLERLRALTAPIASATIEHNLLVSTYADIAGNLEDPWINTNSAVISDLVAAASGESRPAPEAPDPQRFTPVDERDPADEFLLLDADAPQQYVLDVIRSGESVVVSAPPGTGQTQTAVNAIGTLVQEGRSVLVVGERRSSLNELAQQFDQLGLESMLFQATGQVGPQQIKNLLVRAIVRNEKSAEPKLENLHRTLVQHRHQLLDHVASLHNVRQRWGCSPYEAMQSLAELTSIHPAPSTTVRLKRSVLDSIKDRKELAGRLQRAAELGSFSKASTTSAWHGARLVTRKETEEAHDLAARLREKLPLFRDRMAEVSEHSEIRLGRSFAEWGEQLRLLVAVRESLDKFTPDIFDRPVDDLISATASSAWRREHQVDMASMQRSRLRRVAKEYVRPGVHIADLHQSLRLVQEQRSRWAEFSVSQRHPAVPSGLADLSQQHRELEQDLLKLGACLERTAGGGELRAAPYEDLIERLGRLAADRATLESLPERTLLIENMREHGLGELLDDLAEREVGADEVAAELDLAWWQSALEAMISGDDYLAMSDGESLRQLEAEYRLADNAHVASGAARLRWSLASRWRTGIENRSRQAELLRNLLKDGRVSLAALSAQAPDLTPLLVPVWTVSPLMLPSVLPAEQHFDAVVILDAGAASLQSVLPAIGRARQVIAFGDDQVGVPRSFTVGVERLAAGDEQHHPIESAFTALSRVLPQCRLSVCYRSVDEDLTLQLSKNYYGGALQRLPEGTAVTGLDRSLVVEHLAEGTGLPVAGQEAVESVVAEVNRVVDLVFEHARVHPLESLAVITASVRHAARVAEAIRLQMPNHPLLADFFRPGSESFRVVDIDRAGGMVRDRIIFSLGFGRTPHGRAVHSFGPLSAEGGRQRFALAMTRARSFLYIVSCFQPDDLDEARLTNGAKEFYELLDRELAGHSRLGSPASRAAASEQLLGEDPLVADLGERLRVRGARVWHHYDGALDMVAAADPIFTIGKDDAEVPTPVAIESDGTAKYRMMSVRERSKARPQLLERMGWRYLPLWTIEVFTDPSSCADRIGAYLGLEGSAGRPRQPEPADAGFFDAPAAVFDFGAGEAAAEPADEAGGDVPGGMPGQGRHREEESGTATVRNEAGEDFDGQDTQEHAEMNQQDRQNDSDRDEARSATAAAKEELLPKFAAKDDPRTWGDREDEQGHDTWLREQRPPHWG